MSLLRRAPSFSLLLRRTAQRRALPSRVTGFPEKGISMKRIPTIISLNQEAGHQAPPSGKIGVLCDEGVHLPLVRVTKDICPDTLQMGSLSRSRTLKYGEVPELISDNSS